MAQAPEMELHTIHENENISASTTAQVKSAAQNVVHGMPSLHQLSLRLLSSSLLAAPSELYS
jgi:hypothetical protein